MVYITKISDDKFKSDYEAGGKYTVTWLGHIYGKLRHHCFWMQMEFWCSFIDSLFPDWFPLNVVQDVLISIVKAVYDNVAWRYYFDGAYEGDQIIQSLTNVYSDIESRVSQAIEEAKSRVETELITPIRNTINNELSPKITALQNQLSNIETQAGNALNNANSALSSANNAIEQAATALSQAQNAQKTVNEMSAYVTSKIASINQEINSAKSRLSGIDSQITDLINRVKTLEQKVSAQVTTQKTIWEKLFGAT